MMQRFRRLALLAFTGGALPACEQLEQSLPFEATGGSVTRTVTDAGAVVSTPAGASFRIPAGAVAAGTTVTLATVAAPTSLGSATPAGGSAFVLSGEAAELAAPVAGELRVPRAAPQSWLASVVVGTATELRELGDAGVDLAAGVLRTAVPVFGTVTPVIPAADAVVEVKRLGAQVSGPLRTATAPAATPSPTRALRGACGGAAARCTGLEVELSRDLFEYGDRLAVVFPRVSGEIQLHGSRATGSLTLSAPLRLRLNSGAAALTLPVRITVTPSSSTVVTEVPGRIVLSDVGIAVESSTRSEEDIATLAIHYEGERAWFSVARRIGASVGGESIHSTFAATVPLARLP